MKKLFIALAVGVAVFAAAYASAATLGGLNSDDLGSDDDVVASCDADGIVVTYQTAYDVSLAAYEVSSITITGLDNASCSGQTVKATLTGAGNAALVEVTNAPCICTSSTEVLDVDAVLDDLAAELVTGIHVVISGP